MLCAPQTNIDIGVQVSFTVQTLNIYWIRYSYSNYRKEQWYPYMMEQRKSTVELQKGKIVFLNGLTSSGKTSIVDAIQLTSDEFFYVVANDLCEEMIGDRYLREHYLEVSKRCNHYDVSYCKTIF